MKMETCSCMRGRVIEFLIKSIQELEVSPVVKYSALAIFVERFYPSLSRLSEEDKATGNWLLRPVTESNMQLFALVSIWISSKIHGSPSLSVKAIKCLGDKYIKDQHFTRRDILEAEGVLLKVIFVFHAIMVLDFQIGTSSIAFYFLEDLLIQLKEVAQSGQFLKFEACLDIMDLLYEKEETSALFSFPQPLATSVLVAAYVIAVPVQKWEFPILPWVQFVSSCKEDDILRCVRKILSQVFQLDGV